MRKFITSMSNELSVIRKETVEFLNVLKTQAVEASNIVKDVGQNVSVSAKDTSVEPSNNTSAEAAKDITTPRMFPQKHKIRCRKLLLNLKRSQALQIQSILLLSLLQILFLQRNTVYCIVRVIL